MHSLSRMLLKPTPDVKRRSLAVGTTETDRLSQLQSDELGDHHRQILELGGQDFASGERICKPRDLRDVAVIEGVAIVAKLR